MQKIELNYLDIEVTRRCNLKCKNYCMRGKAQNIDMTKDIVDAFFNSESKGYITTSIQDICFSGGEPTLNPEIIIYTINKIIKENIPVIGVSMVTNGQIFVPEIVEAFNMFNEYRNDRVLSDIEREFADYEHMQKILKKRNTDNHAVIMFSIDRFHKSIKEEIKGFYKSYSKGLVIEDKDTKDSEVLKIGLSKFGNEFVGQTFHCVGEENVGFLVMSSVYLTAKGGVIFGGDGSYDYMDANLAGNVNTFSLLSTIEDYDKNNNLTRKRSY